ncbi:hypothetical protein SK128_017913 [Halocaridina rubra]|uniref:Uncharacterized protein n=1 Tax=Halocaridina rubra TaxID=373956 RepID=A0AAN9A4D3_HALRR
MVFTDIESQFTIVNKSLPTHEDILLFTYTYKGCYAKILIISGHNIGGVRRYQRRIIINISNPSLLTSNGTNDEKRALDVEAQGRGRKPKTRWKACITADMKKGPGYEHGKQRGK